MHPVDTRISHKELFMRYVAAVLVLALLCSCGKKEKEAEPLPMTTAEWLEEELDLDEAVVGTPASIVSASAPIDIVFRKAVIPKHLVGSVPTGDVFTFEPPIAGHAVWKSQEMLRFVPDGNLPAGKNVQAVLNGKAAFGEQKRVNDFRFSFKVAEQEILSLTGDFEPVSGVENGVRYRGTVAFAQAVYIEEIRRDLRLTGPGGRVGLTVTADEEPGRVRIESDILYRTSEGKSFTVSLPRKYTVEESGWEQSLFLPEIGLFIVVAHMDMTPPEAARPVYGFRFVDPIEKEMDLSGFVSVEPDAAYEMRIRNKYLLLEGDFVPGHLYTVRIAQGFPCVYGTKLPAEYTAVFSIDNTKPRIEWLQSGVFLPTDNKFKLQFKSVNIKKVRVTVTEIYPHNMGFFIQTNALIDRAAQPLPRYGRSGAFQDLNRVGAEIFEKEFEVEGERNEWVKSEIDVSSVFKGKKNSAFVVQLGFNREDLVGKCVSDRDKLEDGDLYFEKGNYYDDPCQNGYYYSYGKTEKLLISSDIGLTAKRADEGLHIFAVDVLSARPMSGLSLSLFDYQNKKLETAVTDADGHAFFSNDGLYVYGTNASGVALIRLKDAPWRVNNFDIGGATGGGKGMDVFIYTDRGVHRPGDTIHLSAIIRTNRGVPPAKQPVLLSVRNPMRQVAHEARSSCGFNGHVYFPIETDMDDPTGDWIAELTVGDQKFIERLKVETVKPFRLKIDVDVPEEFHPPQKEITGTVKAKYLFGAPAAGLAVKVRADLSGRNFTTREYPRFIFSSPLTQPFRRSDMILDTSLDHNGECSFNYRVPLHGSAPGIVRAELNTTVYEKGGGFTTERSLTAIYPYDAYIGIENVFRYGAAKIGDTYPLPIVVTNSDGEAMSGREIEVTVYVSRSHWWWHYDRRDRKDFRKLETTYLVGEYTYHSQKEPIIHNLAVEDYGRHFIEVKDVASGHEVGFFFYASGWGMPVPEEEQERNYLQITADRELYRPGDRAVLGFECPPVGMALLTIEQGDLILHREWRPVRGSTSSFTVNITEEMLPNCYASISLIQPHGQETNDLPMRLYGIKTLKVEDEATRLPMELDAPDELEPGQEFTIGVTSASRERSSCTIAIVDEGLLDLTGFETPAPWDHFFQKIRLGISTLDNFDQILGALYPDIDKYFSIGGGMSLGEERKKRTGVSRVSRFEPVVLFEKPVTIEPGSTVRTAFTMPNYVGSVRVMVVGAAGGSYASIEKTVPVRQPLMVLPTVPRVARPGDEFALPVSVFTMDDAIRDVRLSLGLSSNLKSIGPLEIRIPFEKSGERDTAFTVAVGNSVGSDTVTVAAASGRERADYTVHLPVESPNPYFTEVTDTMVAAGKSVVLVPQKFGLEGTNEARIAFTRVPDIQLDKRLAYLIRYPYGCIEQTVSAVFAQLFLPGLADLRPHQKQMVTDNINEAIGRLSRYQMTDGFSFWPAEGYRTIRLSDWGSNYVGHFLLEARGKGYHVPKGLFEHWLKTAQKRAKRVDRKNHRYQTYRLFLLALAGEPNAGAMNLVRENHLSELDPLSRKLLAAAYYISGEKEAAGVIDRSAPTEIPPYRELGGTYGSPLRDRALIAYLCIKMNDLESAGRLLRDVTREFTPERWYSTQETAMALLCIGAFYDSSPFTGGAVTFELEIGDAKAETVTLGGYRTARGLERVWGEEIRITNKSGNPLFVTLSIEGIPVDDRIETGYSGVTLARNFYDADGRPLSVKRLPQGKSFWVVYTVGNEIATPLENLALTSVFPSGWEIINRRLSGQAVPDWVQRLRVTAGDYMDIRDDRINWFFDLPPKGARVFAVEINPTFRGRYRLPPVVLEAMYSPEYFARIAGGEVTVE
jgi:uncharacterized protein YfaS (alpha-2-macroglobulin family)